MDSELNHTVGLQPTSPVGSLAVGIPTVFFRDLSGPEYGGSIKPTLLFLGGGWEVREAERK